MNLHPTRCAALFCASAYMAFGGAANAQPASETAVQEVVVTAQRRSERLEDVPMSVTAITPQAMERAGAISILEINRIAPSAQLNYGTAGTLVQPAIRGVTTLTTGFNVENNVAIYVDGFYDPSPITINMDLANLASIEVLKGPQGTLYGRNATGGAILVNTLTPTRTLTGKVEATYARYGDRRLSGYVSGPLSDRVRGSLSAYWRRSDGYIKLSSPTVIGGTAGDAAPLRQEAVRGRLEIDVTDKLTATLGLNYAMLYDGRGSLFSVFDHISPALPPPPTRPTRFGTAAYNRESGQLGITREATVKLAYQTPIGALTSYTGYAHRDTKTLFDFDGSYAQVTYADIAFDQDTWQQAIDYQITAIPHVDLVIGGLYYNSQIHNAPNRGVTLFGPNTVFASRARYRELAEAWAVYADATYHVSDRLALNLGGRFSHDYKTFTFLSFGATGAFIVPPTTDDHTWTKFTPRATLRYELAPRTNVYASWTKGFRSGTYNGSGPTPGLPMTPTNPENITAYELGFKTARSRLRFDIAGFYYDYKDINVGVMIPNPSCPAGVICNNVSIFANAEGAKIYGVDGQLTFTPIDRLNIHAGAAYLHARYKSFPNATGVGVDATNTANIPNQLQDWSGDQMSRSPTFAGNIGFDYETPLPAGSLLLSSNLSYTDSFVLSNPTLYGPLAPPALRDKQRFRQKAHALLSAQATWTDPSDRYWVTIFGNNLTNTSYRMTWNAGVFGDYSTKGEPRTYGVKVGYKF